VTQKSLEKLEKELMPDYVTKKLKIDLKPKNQVSEDDLNRKI